MQSRSRALPIWLIRIIVIALPLLPAFSTPGHCGPQKEHDIEFVNTGDSDLFLAVKTGTEDCTKEGDEEQMILQPDQSYSVDADFACYGFGTDKQHTTDWKKAKGRGVIELSVDDD